MRSEERVAFELKTGENVLDGLFKLSRYAYDHEIRQVCEFAANEYGVNVTSKLKLLSVMLN